MRKSTFANYPPATEQLSDGRVRVNYNVEESTEEVPILDPETQEPTGETKTVTIYLCQSVDIDKFDRNTLIVALIREQYTIDDEFAILRQKESKVAEYEAYYAYTENCKTIADSFFNTSSE
jgi:hypothetical protein